VALFVDNQQGVPTDREGGFRCGQGARRHMFKNHMFKNHKFKNRKFENRVRKLASS
jgi:hypothetical protein